LPLFSELLAPAQFQALVGLYAKAAATFTLLEGQASRATPFTPGAVEQFRALAQEFAIAAQVVAAYVWPKKEQQRLERVRNGIIATMGDTNGQPAGWDW
jgi:hypothetical protein